MNYIAIDIGLSGAVVLQEDRKFHSVTDVPTFEVKTGKKRRNEYDRRACFKILKDISILFNGDDCHAIFEKLRGMPGQSSTSTYKLGYGSGMWEAFLVALDIPYTAVSPVKWKNVMLEGISKEAKKQKGAAVLRAKELFPEVDEHLTLVKHHNRADAILMAEYLRRTLK